MARIVSAANGKGEVESKKVASAKRAALGTTRSNTRTARAWRAAVG